MNNQQQIIKNIFKFKVKFQSHGRLIAKKKQTTNKFKIFMIFAIIYLKKSTDALMNINYFFRLN